MSLETLSETSGAIGSKFRFRCRGSESNADLTLGDVIYECRSRLVLIMGRKAYVRGRTHLNNSQASFWRVKDSRVKTAAGQNRS